MSAVIDDAVGASGVVVRPLTESDWSSWHPMWQGYLDFYRHALPPATTEQTFARLCSGGGGAGEGGMFGLVAASRTGDLVGFAHSVLHPSTWALSGYCYLEDLWVDRVARGSGAGRALIDATCEVAAQRGVSRTYWHTQQYNGAARSLYDSLAHVTSFVMYERDSLG